MQPQPQTIALPQAPPPFARGGSFLFGRGIGVGSSPPFLRVGRLMPANELLRQRMAPDLVSCPDFLQRQTEGPHKPYDTQWGSKGGGRGPPPLSLTADVVGYTGGGGGAGRVSLSVAPQYTSVAASHPPPNTAAQVQQASQNQQIRAQAPPLPPTHNPHNTAGAPPPSASHSQHLTHPHSALVQHQHHQALSSANVSGAAGGLANQIPQSAVSVQPGQSPAPPGSQHELNAQGIPQATSQQLQQGTGVALAGSVTAAHSMMYPTSNPNQIPQTPQTNPPQVRNLIGTQFYHHGQQTAAHLHQGGQQHRQVVHSIPNMQAYPYNLISPIVQHPNQYPQTFASQFPAAAMTQHRPGATNNQHQYAAQMAPPAPNHFHIAPFHQVQGYQYVEGNGKTGWGVKSQYGAQPAVFFPAAATANKTAQHAPAREKKIIAIIDPISNKNILEDMNPAMKPSPSPSPMQSRESSTATTPAPSETVHNKSTQHIPTEFALQVLLQSDNATSVTNEQSEPVDCGLSTNKSIEPSHCVPSEISEKEDRIINSVDSQKEPVNVINQNRIVPEQNSISCEQTVTIQAQPNLPPQFSQPDNHSVVHPTPASNVPQSQPQTQPPPQPQRPAKQPRGSQQQQQPLNLHSSQGNHSKGNNQQQTNKQQQQQQQQSPPQHGNKNQKTGGTHMPQKGNQTVQGQQQQTKGRASPNAQQQQKNLNNNQNALQQQSHLPQQPSKQILPPAPQQSKLPSDSQQTSKMQPPLAPPQHMHQINQPVVQQSQGQMLKEQGVPQHQGSVIQIQNSVQQQKMIVHGQGIRGPSPPQQLPIVPQGMVAGRRMSGEQVPAASAGPIKPDKRPSPPVEHVPRVIPEVKELVNKPNSKSASVSPMAGSAKKETTPEPVPSNLVKETTEKVTNDGKQDDEDISREEKEIKTNGKKRKYKGRKSSNGKRGGKDKVADEPQQSKEVKEPPKAQIEELSPQRVVAETPPATTQTNNKQLSQGKPPKPQPTVEKGAEATIQQPMQSTSHSPPKSESPILQVVQARITPQVPEAEEMPEEAVLTPDVVDISDDIPSSEPLKPEPEEVQLNHVDEAQVNNHEENHISEKPKSSSLKKYNYKEGQWSPENQDGKRQYDRDFLLEMQKNPLSLRRPDSLPNLEVVLDGPVNRQIDGKHKMMSDFTPSFLQNTRGRHHTPFMQPKYVGGRSSQQGQKKGSDKGDKDKSSELKIINVNFDHRLQKATNAWKPTSKKTDVTDDDTVRRMRGILNKLTPENFKKLVEQVKNMNIKKFATFDKVIGLIFEKAVDEQAFSTTYAELCKVLSQMSIKVDEKDDETRFRNLIISKCQTEFEKDNKKDLNREEKEKEISEQKLPEKRTELKAVLEFEEARLRKRSVGNIRFIGELYKLKMLTSSIMMRIILALLGNKDEEALECLCKLLTTIGKMLESNAQNSAKAQGDLNEIFTTMRQLVESRLTSSRVRFLLMDVIDLRKNNWIPRREDTKPKTKAEVHEEIRKEEMEQQYLLCAAPPRRDDRERKRSRDNRGMMMNVNADDGWSIASSNSRRGPFDTKRIQNSFGPKIGDGQVEFRAGFSNWARGSSGGMKEQEEDPRNNRFSVLDHQNPDMRRNNPMPPRLAPSAPYHRQGTGSYGSKSMPPPSEKENIPITVKPLAAAGDRSKSNSRSNSRQSSRENSLVREPPGTPLVHPIEPVHDVVLYSKEEAEKYMKNIVEEYALNNYLPEAITCVQEKFKGQNIVLFIQCSLEWALERNADKRRKLGILYNALLKSGLLSLPQLLEGLRDVVECISDIEIDIPQVCAYVGAILSRLLVDDVLKLDDIMMVIEPAGPKAPTIFAKVIKEASSALGEARVREMWKACSSLDQVVPPSTVNEYITQHDILFVLKESVMYSNRPIADEEAPIEVKFIRKELSRLFKNMTEDEEIFKWIDANVGRFTNTKKFVRALTSALLESLTLTDGNSYTTVDKFEEQLKEKVKFLQKYIDGNQHLELACLFGVQSLSVEYQHPSGLLERTFNILYDSDIIVDDTFFKWEKNDEPEEQLGKGVCLTSVNKLLKFLGEEGGESGAEEN